MRVELSKDNKPVTKGSGSLSARVPNERVPSAVIFPEMCAENLESKPLSAIRETNENQAIGDGVLSVDNDPNSEDVRSAKLI